MRAGSRREGTLSQAGVNRRCEPLTVLIHSRTGRLAQCISSCVQTMVPWRRRAHHSKRAGGRGAGGSCRRHRDPVKQVHVQRHIVFARAIGELRVARLSAAAVGGHHRRRAKAKSRNRSLIARGTGSSNPFPSSGESCANLTFGANPIDGRRQKVSRETALRQIVRFPIVEDAQESGPGQRATATSWGHPVRREYWQRDAVAATLYSRRVSAPGDEIVLAPRRV